MGWQVDPIQIVAGKPNWTNLSQETEESQDNQRLMPESMPKLSERDRSTSFQVLKCFQGRYRALSE